MSSERTDSFSHQSDRTKSGRDYHGDFKRAAKEHLRAYTQTITDAAPRQGKNAFVCPCCKSGTGNNNHYTAAFFLYRNKAGEMHFKCHACGVEGDIFTLAGLMNNTTDFREQKRLVAEFLNLDIAHHAPLDTIQTRDTATNNPPDAQQTEALKKQAATYISDCEKQVEQTDYFARRGLTPQTVKRMHLGYDSKRQRAVIPFTKNYYVARDTRVPADAKDGGDKDAPKHYNPFGLRQPLFNMNALGAPSGTAVFICEAPLDAISIMQSGGHAIALGGTSAQGFAKAIAALQPEATFILYLDNDGPGLRARDALCGLLERNSIPYRTVQDPVLLAAKDPNAALMADEKAFTQAIEREIIRATTKERGTMAGFDYRTKPESELTYYIFDNLRCTQDHTDSNVYRFDTLEEAATMFKQLPKEWTTALGGSIDGRREVDFVQRREGAPVLVTDYQQMPYFKDSPEVNQAISSLGELLGIEWQCDRSLLNTSIHIPYEGDEPSINNYINGKLLHPSVIGVTNSAIQEAYVQGTGWVGLPELVGMSREFGYDNAHCPQVSTFNIAYTTDTGLHSGFMDISPAEYGVMKESFAAWHREAQSLDPLDVACDIDAFVRDNDTYEYRDQVDDPIAAVEAILGSLKAGETHGLKTYLLDFASGENGTPAMQKEAKELIQDIHKLSAQNQGFDTLLKSIKERSYPLPERKTLYAIDPALDASGKPKNKNKSHDISL